MFEALLQSGRILKVEQLTDLSEGYAPEKPFSLMLVPASGSDVNVGDVVTVTAKPPMNDEAAEIPVTVGEWSLVVFDNIAVDGVELDDVDCFVAPITLK